jgi:hypothetical protein
MALHGSPPHATQVEVHAESHLFSASLQLFLHRLLLPLQLSRQFDLIFAHVDEHIWRTVMQAVQAVAAVSPVVIEASPLEVPLPEVLLSAVVVGSAVEPPGSIAPVPSGTAVVGTYESKSCVHAKAAEPAARTASKAIIPLLSRERSTIRTPLSCQRTSAQL